MPVVLMIAELHGAWKAGLMYEAGGWVDQPAWYVEAMTAMEGALNREEAKRLKAQQHA